MKRKLLLIVFIVFGIMAFANMALAECTDHNYYPLTDLQLRTVHRGVLLCTQCGEVNSSQVDCSKCDGSGKIVCSRCNGEQIVWHLCMYCYGSGKQKNGKKCTCELYGGKTGYTYDLCTECGGIGFDFCSKTVDRSNCQECKASSSKLVCGLCYDKYDIGECPVCAEDTYAKFDYNEIMRRPEENQNNRFHISGAIIDIESLAQVSSGTVYSITLKHQQLFKSYTYNVMYYAPKSEAKLLVGDKVSMWGNFVSYTRDNVPQFNIYYAELQ